MDDEKNEDKQRAGQIGGAKRAKVLSPDRRAEIARRAAKSRWATKSARATHKGSFKAEFGIDVDCYVLDDDAKTAVINQRGMGAALGLGESGGCLPMRWLAIIRRHRKSSKPLRLMFRKKRRGTNRSSTTRSMRNG